MRKISRPWLFFRLTVKTYFGIFYNRIYNYTKDMANSIYLKEYKRVIERLKNARQESGLKQIEVAERLGKPQSYISKIEQGERRVDIAELKLIAQTYKKDVNYFISK